MPTHDWALTDLVWRENAWRITPVVEIASLRYFTEDGVRYWTLHTDLERLDRHQLVALAEMVRAEQAKRARS